MAVRSSAFPREKTCFISERARGFFFRINFFFVRVLDHEEVKMIIMIGIQEYPESRRYPKTLRKKNDFQLSCPVLKFIFCVPVQTTDIRIFVPIFLSEELYYLLLCTPCQQHMLCYGNGKKKKKEEEEGERNSEREKSL